jgi:hypothetical protein
MKLPISTDYPDNWTVIKKDVEMVNIQNLNTLNQNWSNELIREPFRKAFLMTLTVQANAGGKVKVFMPGPGKMVARPIIENGSIVGHRIGVRYSEFRDADQISPDVVEREQPFVLWYSFTWTGQTQAQTLKNAIQQHYTAGRIRRGGHPGVLSRKALDDVQETLDALSNQGITIPEYQDGNPTNLGELDWQDYLFDLWWYGLTYVQMYVDSDSDLAKPDGSLLVEVGPEVKVSLNIRGRFAFQPFYSDYVWMNPGYVLSGYLSDDDKTRAQQLGLIGTDEKAYIVGKVPRTVEDVRPYLVIGNEDRGWRYFLPHPDDINMGFSFVTWDRLYLAHNGTSATLTLSGGGMENSKQGDWPPGENEIILNRDLRPDHPLYPRTKRERKQARKQPRTTEPLLLRIEVAGDNPKSFTLEQDEPDIIRQEFGFHMNWKSVNNDYYYQKRETHKGIPSDDHVQVGNKPHFKIKQPTGSYFYMSIPEREDLRMIQPEERREYERLVLKGSQSIYNFTLLSPQWQYWINQINNSYRQLRAEVIANSNNLPDFFGYYVGRYTAELGATLDLEALIPDGLQISSSWRPPQHNEAVGGAYASFHQSGLALDIQPRGTGPGRRRPIAMMILHYVTTELLGANHLRTALLELGGSLFVFGAYQDQYRDWEIREERLQGNRKRYRMARIVNNNEEQSEYCEEAQAEETDVYASGGLRENLINKYVIEELGFDNANITVDWPSLTDQNRYSDLYWFALKTASHVHVDFYS